MNLLWSSIALGAPTFSGSDHDVALAGRIWPAAVACAGWEPVTHPTIRIVRQPLPSGYGGQASIDAGGLAWIEIDPDGPEVLLAHELGHAWFHTGPRTLAEGRAEVLAECVAERLPDDVRFLRSDDLDTAVMSDLLTWADSPNPDAETLAMYTASWRMFRIFADLVPPARILAADVTDWPAVMAVLSGAGPQGERVRAVLESGVVAQRLALEDTDLDGLVALHEGVLGLDPSRWDTDGDGWWDGADDRPTGAIPLPRDGTHVCVPVVARSGGTRVEFGGNVRGVDLLRSEFVADSNDLVSGARFTSARGGAWILPVGDLRPNPRCRTSVTTTLVVDRGIDVDRFAEALESAQARFAEVLGPSGRRLVVHVDSDRDWIGTERGSVIAIPVDVASAVESPEQATSLAGYAVAVHWLHERRHPQASLPSLVNALRDGVLGAKGPILGDTYRSEIKAWARKAEACGGWDPLVSRSCVDKRYTDR